MTALAPCGGATWMALSAAAIGQGERALWSAGDAALSLGVVLTGLGAAGLLVGCILAEWRRRRRAWASQPRLLLEPLAPQPLADAGIVLLSVLAGGLATAARSGWTPPGVALAAVATLGLGHRRERQALSVLGLLLLGEAVVLTGIDWWPGGSEGLVTGWSLAGLYLLWLGRFWSQQLLNGTAWTTAGRLIPAARWLGVICCVACILTAGTLSSSAQTVGRWGAIAVAASALALAARMAAEVRAHRRRRAGRVDHGR